MTGRIKFQVWAADKARWRTAYVLSRLLIQNVKLFEHYGFRVRYAK